MVNRRKSAKLRTKIMQILEQSSCQICGYSIFQALQLDHINDDGHIIRDYVSHPDKVYRFYIDNPDIAKKDLQVLCANCNWIKRWKND